MVPPQLHVICEVFRYVAAPVLTSIGIFDCILLPCPRYNFAKNVISSSVRGIDYLPKFH